MGKQFTELLGVLACTRCRGGVERKGEEALLCARCGAEYKVLRGVPIMLSDDEQGRMRELLASWKKEEIRPGIPYRTLKRVMSPALHRTREEDRFITNLLERIPGSGIVLDVGSGASVFSDRITRLDIGPFPGIDVVGDAHSLPFVNDSVDCIVLHRVLEHVHDPVRAVREAHRVLKRGGIVTAIVPFLEPYHRNPIDNLRFSSEGLGALFGDFEKLKLDWIAGPSAALAWMLKEYVAVLFPFSNHPRVYAGVREAMGWLVYPLRWIDRFLRKKTHAERIACEFHYVGRKPGVKDERR